MAHFAKIGVGNVVVKVHVVSNDVATSEQAGVDFLNNLYKSRDVWVQTSYNTKSGVHLNGGTPFRKNYAGVGYTYDQSRDAFIPPKKYKSWTLNETTCLWDPPVAKPELTEEQINNKNYYSWNEETQQWDLNE